MKNLHIDADSVQSSDHGGEDAPKLFEVLLGASPFIGYLCAYLVRLGKAAYLRIPTQYVRVGLEDTLIMGALIIVVSIAAYTLTHYLRETAPWRFEPHDSGPLLNNVYGNEVDFDNIWVMYRWYASGLVYAAVYVASLVLLTVFFWKMIEWLILAATTSGADVAGQDWLFAVFMLIGLPVFVAEIVYLRFSHTGKDIRDNQVPGGFAGLTIWQLVLSITMAILISGAFFLNGFSTSSGVINILVSANDDAVIIESYSDGSCVVSGFTQERRTDGVRVVRLSGNYEFMSMPEGTGLLASDTNDNGLFDRDSSFHWERVHLLRP